MTNTLAYYITKPITATKSFMIQVQGQTIVIIYFISEFISLINYDFFSISVANIGIMF
jgi:hypothetical protein